MVSGTVLDGAPRATILDRARSVAAVAAEHLSLPQSEVTRSALGQHLEHIRQRLERQITECPEPTDDLLATRELLISVLQTQCEVMDHHLAAHITSFSEIRNILAALRGLSPHEMIAAVPAVLTRHLEFSRSMISTVRGSAWLPKEVHMEDEDAYPGSPRFRQYIDGAHIRLADAPLETELVRRRRGAIVASAKDDKRTFKELVEVAGCFGYIAAPIIVQGRAIGIVHADRPEPYGLVTIDHLDQLETFVECLAVAFESAVLAAKVIEQRTEVANLSAGVDALLAGVGQSSPSPSPSVSDPGWRPDSFYRRDRPAIPTLSAREREVMSHVATGATNGQIASSMAISEGTVKSHLKHIAKKLNTSSRAAAVAACSNISTGGTGAAQ